MAYIYQIINDINNKIYIGKTESSIEKRFQEHCRDCQKSRCEKRPLYAAMNKYGIEHFHISLIEETNFPEEREKYWIEQLGSFKYGYNATIGGDGRRYIDYNLVCQLYQLNSNQAEVARILNIDESTVHRILKENKICTSGRGQYSKTHIAKSVIQYNKTGDKIINIYDSSIEAAQALKTSDNLVANISTIAGHIRAVCNYKRKTAYNYYWRFL